MHWSDLIAPAATAGTVICAGIGFAWRGRGWLAEHFGQVAGAIHGLDVRLSRSEEAATLRHEEAHRRLGEVERQQQATWVRLDQHSREIVRIQTRCEDAGKPAGE